MLARASLKKNAQDDSPVRSIKPQRIRRAVRCEVPSNEKDAIVHRISMLPSANTTQALQL